MATASNHLRIKAGKQFFSQMPSPWPAAENAFSRALTDLGFGRKYVAEFYRDGEQVRMPFSVEQSPPHYDAAERYKSVPIGITLRHRTYEVRRHFQKTGEDPGVIVAKIETGGKAAVAGIRPYEIITQVNGRPVRSVVEFEKSVDRQQEVRLSVERMMRGRTVRISLPEVPAPETE